MASGGSRSAVARSYLARAGPRPARCRPAAGRARCAYDLGRLTCSHSRRSLRKYEYSRVMTQALRAWPHVAELGRDRDRHSRALVPAAQRGRDLGRGQGRGRRRAPVRALGSGHSFTPAAATERRGPRPVPVDRGHGRRHPDGPGHGAVRDHAAGAQRRAGRSRAGPGQPGRHRRADDRGRAVHRNARHRRPARRARHPGRGARPGPGRRFAGDVLGFGAARAVRGRARRARRARRDHRGDAALRAVVHAGRGRAPGCRSTRSSSEFDALAAANDHFEFYWFPYGRQALVKRNNRLPPAEAAPRRGGPRRRCRGGGGSGSSR